MLGGRWPSGRLTDDGISWTPRCASLRAKDSTPRASLATDTDRIESAGVPLREQLRRFARIYLGSWLMTPDLIAVLVREIARSPAVGNRLVEVRGVFLSLQRMIAAAQERGEVRADCNTQLAAWAVYGALEEILTGWVLGQLPAEEEDVERAVVTVVDVAYAGLAA